jgi:hypothetical protein
MRFHRASPLDALTARLGAHFPVTHTRKSKRHAEACRRMPQRVTHVCPNRSSYFFAYQSEFTAV